MVLFLVRIKKVETNNNYRKILIPNEFIYIMFWTLGLSFALTCQWCLLSVLFYITEIFSLNYYLLYSFKNLQDWFNDDEAARIVGSAVLIREL